MITAAEIEKQIEALPGSEFKKLRTWFAQKDMDAWDKEVEADSKSGVLNFLVKEVTEARYNNKLRDM